MRKTFFLIFALGLLGSFATASAEIRLGYVDLQAALNKSEAGKEANSKLNEVVAARQTAITEMEEKIKSLQDNVKKQRHLMGETALREKEDEIERLLRDYKRIVTDAQDEIKKKEAQLVSGIMDALHQVVKDIGKEDGYTVIFEQNASRLLYADEAIDITDRVVERFNKGAK